MTPRTMALAYRIWAYATPREWDCTYTELAEHFRVHPSTIVQIAKAKGWLHRIRRSAPGSTVDSPFNRTYQRPGRGVVDSGFDDGSVGI
jgi:hypothetical protein